MGLMLAALTLTNCSKEEATETPNLTQGFTIHANYTPVIADYAAYDDTRTTFDPVTGKTAWVASDELLVFCRETGSTSTSWTQYKFTTTAADAAQGIFTNSTITIDPAKSYDWYLINNYTRELKYMKDPIKGTYTIGNQTQTGATTDHLSDVDGLVGMATNISGSKTPGVTMKHVCTLMKFTLVNKEAEAITPTKIMLEHGDGSIIGGYYTIDYATGAVTIDGGNYADTSLTLKDAPAIAPNGTFDAYLAVAPFTIASGKDFKISVTTDQGAVMQTRTMSKDVTFAPGKINTATIQVKLPEVNQNDESFVAFTHSGIATSSYTDGTATSSARTIWTYVNSRVDQKIGAANAVTFKNAAGPTLSATVSGQVKTLGFSLAMPFSDSSVSVDLYINDQKVSTYSANSKSGQKFENIDVSTLTTTGTTTKIEFKNGNSKRASIGGITLTR